MDRQKKIPSGKLKRSGIVAVTTARAGLKKMGYLSKKPFLSPVNKNREGQRNDEEIAKLIFKALSALRGTALKAAQMMSMEMELVPEAYRREMAKAASQVPPINRALIRKIIIRELGAPPEKIFKSFDAIPFAAASLGQVHRAVSDAGEELAVKVQYPGIAESVTSDIDMLKALLRPSRYYRIFSFGFDEIEARISEELDYVKEAENTTWFGEHLNIKNIVTPRVYPEFSTTHILTTEMIHGLHLDQWLQSHPSRETRNHFGQLLVDLFNDTAQEQMLIHADPNMGNYLFMDGGKLGVIDFGCVKKLNADFVRALNISLDDDFDDDPEKLKAFYQCVGIHFKRDFKHKAFRAFLHRWIEWIIRPEREAYFEFSEESAYFEEGLALLKDFYRYIDYFEGDFMYFGRAHYGLRRLLQKIGTKVRMRP